MVELSVRGPCWVKGAQCSGFNGFFSSGAVREMLRCRGLQASLAGGRKGERYRIRKDDAHDTGGFKPRFRIWWEFFVSSCWGWSVVETSDLGMKTPCVS